jgi:hypothetical protein
MTLLAVCCLSSFAVGMYFYRFFGFTYYKHKVRQLMKICDRYKDLNGKMLAMETYSDLEE